jgi:hypothetical protein
VPPAAPAVSVELWPESITVLDSSRTFADCAGFTFNVYEMVLKLSGVVAESEERTLYVNDPVPIADANRFIEFEVDVVPVKSELYTIDAAFRIS